MNSQYDVIIIGGGPAGSTAAAITAQAGLSTLLLERDKFPRFHVGESLMPECYWIFRRIGALDKMQERGFVKKLSVQFVSHTGNESQPFYFREHDPRECSETWQVERSAFDQLLFENARERGAECHEKTRVQEVLFEGDRACGVRLPAEGTGPGGKETKDIRARVVIDATGQQALLAHRLGLKIENPKLKKAAIWGYYSHARRDPGENTGATIILQSRDKQAWFWFIPLANEITSIGVVGDRDYLLKGRGSPETTFEDELVKCPALANRLMNARLTSEFHVIKEFSYFTSRHAGDGWVLIGDAWGFIDPIYSSGVYFALKSAEMAADAVIEGLSRGDTSGEQLGKWTSEFKSGVEWIRKLVDAYYTNEFSFGAFMREYPQHRGNLTDLLIGRIFYDGAGRIFQDMDPRLAMATKKAADAQPSSS